MKSRLLVVFLLVLFGCSFPRIETKYPIGHAKLVKYAPECVEPKSNYFMKCYNLAKYFEEGGNLDKQDIQVIMQGRLRLGMTQEMVKFTWRYPDRINRTGGSWGIREQWVYEGGQQGLSSKVVYLYFENGKLTSWQD